VFYNKIFSCHNWRHCFSEWYDVKCSHNRRCVLQ